MAGIQKEVKAIFYFSGQLRLFPSHPFLVLFSHISSSISLLFPDSSSVRHRGTFFLCACLLSNKEMKYEQNNNEMKL